MQTRPGCINSPVASVHCRFSNCIMYQDLVASFETILWAPSCFNLFVSNEAGKSVFLTYSQDIRRLLFQGIIRELLFCLPVLSDTSRSESGVTSRPAQCPLHSRVPHCPCLLCARYTHQSMCLLAQSLPV